MPARMYRAVLRDGWLVVHGITVAVPLWFAFVLSLPANTFDGASYAGMLRLGSEHTWAMASSVVGVAAGMSWFISNRWVWLASCMGLMMWHGLVSLCIWQASPAGTGSGTYAVLAAAATVKLLRPLDLRNAHTARP